MAFSASMIFPLNPMSPVGGLRTPHPQLVVIKSLRPLCPFSHLGAIVDPSYTQNACDNTQPDQHRPFKHIELTEPQLCGRKCRVPGSTHSSAMKDHQNTGADEPCSAK